MKETLIISGNRDICGRCGSRHGGNDHSCPVHGCVSAGCCQPACLESEWRRVYLTWDSQQKRCINPATIEPQNWAGVTVVVERNGQPINSPRFWSGGLRYPELRNKNFIE